LFLPVCSAMGLEGRIVEAGLFFLEKPGPMAIPAIAGDPMKVECGLSLISPSPEDSIL
jgi:hypothetical protein